MFFQKLKHRARECASVLVYCSVTAYLHQRMTCYCGSYQESSWEAFPGRELKNFPNVGGALKGIQRCVLLFRRSVTHRFSQFVKCQNSTGNTQVLYFLSLFPEDVDPDKELRRYHGLDLEV